MTETKKVKRKKFNFLKFLIFCLFVYLLVSLVLHLLKIPIKNVLILNNRNISDIEIMQTAKIDDYPSFFKTMNFKIEKRLKKNPLIKEVKIKKKLNYILEIDVEEYKFLYQVRSNNSYVLEDGKTLDIKENIQGVPILINYVPDDIIYKLNKKMAKLNVEVISKISEIEYTPNDYDKERFLLYMSDGNEVYITITKLENLNKYFKIVKQLDSHQGVLYLDSGNYFEIKD